MYSDVSEIINVEGYGELFLSDLSRIYNEEKKKINFKRDNAFEKVVLSLKEGDIVVHKNFSVCKIVSVDIENEQLSLVYGNGVTKVLVYPYVVQEKIIKSLNIKKLLLCSKNQKKVTELINRDFFQEAYGFYDSNLRSYGYDDWFFKKAKERIEFHLKQYKFIFADECFAKIYLDKDEQDRLKTKYVQKWFQENVTEGEEKKPYLLDDHQALAVVNSNKNTIVTARAGSGKTRTLVAKIIYLMAIYGILPNEIMAFVFNRKAMEEINSRLQTITVGGKLLLNDCEIAKTFHSFASHVCRDVFEENIGDVLHGEKRTKFIKKIVDMVLSKEEIYTFFRKEALCVEKKYFSSEADYYVFLRNSKYRTLDGIEVKSLGEKIIADYLFEHGIKFYYENDYMLSSFYPFCNEMDKEELFRLKNQFNEGAIRPDFYLLDYSLFWEHWAITGKETKEKIKEINDCQIIGDYDTYLGKMVWKRWFYSRTWMDNNVPVISKRVKQIVEMKGLIETYSSDLMPRELFENYIEKILAKKGIVNGKLPADVLIAKVWERQISQFVRLIEQFIDRAEQKFLDNMGELEQKIASIKGDERTESFLKMALRCYKKYLEYFAGQWSKKELKNFEDFYGCSLDFGMLLNRAIKLLNLPNKNAIKILSNVKFILIDEYQDFSKLFFFY